MEYGKRKEYLAEQKEWQGCKECGKGEKSFKVETVEKWVKANNNRIQE